VSRDSIVDGDWLPALSDVSVICRIRRVRRNLRVRSVYRVYTDCTGQGNDFKLIPTVKMAIQPMWPRTKLTLHGTREFSTGLFW